MHLILTASRQADSLVIQVQPPSLPPTAAVPSKHACFFMDTSGSMSEDNRIIALIDTMKLLVTKKPASYRFTFISYSSIAKLDALAEADPVPLLAAINRLNATGGTNLEAAAFQLQEVVKCGIPIDAIVLFTDGHVNEGSIRKSTGFLSLLRSILPAIPPIHTIGCGANYNQQFLKAVSEETRSIHFYADAGETLPAVVADILEGMRTEIGTKAQLPIPDGWINAEHGRQLDRTVSLGHLIADHTQYMVLKQVIESATVPTLTLTYVPSGGDEIVSTSCAISDGLTPVQMAEQIARVRIAGVYNEVWDLLEVANQAEALVKLTALSLELSVSLAKSTPFLLTALAQIDEMKESILTPPPDAWVPRGPLGPLGGAPPLVRNGGPPQMMHTLSVPAPPVLSRLASNTVALTTQRGFFSRTTSGPPDQTITFSSPSQQRAQRDLTQSYEAEDTTPDAVNVVIN
jgi:hypothetical protein